jgi:hypothetical protein
MPRPRLLRLVVSGVGKEDAELVFNERLTFITGASNTGKSHILKCIDFALGGPVPEMDFAEASGYTRVQLEFAVGDDRYSIARDVEKDEPVEWFAGSLSDWDDEKAESLRARISKQPDKTLSGRLLALAGFDTADTVVKNQRGEAQSLSFRTVVPLILVSEEDVIRDSSPILPPSYTQHTAAKSVFQILLQGRGPTEEEVARLRAAHRGQERAKSQLQVLEPIIAQLRDEILDSGLTRGQLDQDLKAIDDELAQVSEIVAASGDAAAKLISQRNDALTMANNDQARASHSAELASRFRLLAEHYNADAKRLGFLLEGGHFFQQMTASYCPRCGRELDVEDRCHEEAATFDEIERSVRAELKKLEPRRADLQVAIEEADAEVVRLRATARHASATASALDAEIKLVANPSAKSARNRVQGLASRRREIEANLLRHRELERYLAIQLEADVEAKKTLDRFRPDPEAASLKGLQEEIAGVLSEWQFPFSSDVFFDVGTDDLSIDGKPRAVNGKGVRAVTHAAFTVGLMRFCIGRDSAHPGFVAIDTPLNPFRGASEPQASDVEPDVHAACLRSLARRNALGQAIIIDNIDAPPELGSLEATIYRFDGPNARDRQGFYPPPRTHAQVPSSA